MTSVHFPDGFLWGAATSAHQVEGQNLHSDWWAWERAGRVPEASADACDHYHRFAEDFDLAAQLGHNAHRFSIEWSRIEPAEGRFEAQAVAHYRDVVHALRHRGLEPIVTLHHFTSPQWLAETGGWTNAKAVEWFGRYVEYVASVLGETVRYWITINEPMVYVHMHYLEGEGPPGVRDLRRGMQVLANLIRAHALAYRILHRLSSVARVSVAKHLPVFQPCRRWWPPDRWAAWLTDRVFNGAFLEAVRKGRVTIPGIGLLRCPEALGTLDYLGVNFYRRHFIRASAVPGPWLGRSCDLGHHAQDITERTTWMGWDVHPESFFRTLSHWGRLGLPMLVTENGTCMVDDARRWHYIATHLQAMARAMDQGAKVIGYLYWSLLDNFEWAHGFAPRFGIVEVDRATQQRQIRDSGRKFAEVCRTNRLMVQR